MTRGVASEVGDTFVNKNGYHHTRTEEGWKLTHRLIAEKKLGRPLKSNEMARFIDNDKTNLNPDNIKVVEKGQGSLRRREAQIEAQIDELQAQLADIRNGIE